MKSWNGFTCSSTSYSNQQLHNNPLNRDNGVILEGMDKEHCPALSIPFYSDKSNHHWQKTAFPSDNPTEIRLRGDPGKAQKNDRFSKVLGFTNTQHAEEETSLLG